MAQNKTIPTAASPSAFIDHVADEPRRKDCTALVALMREATGHPPKMWGASIRRRRRRDTVYTFAWLNVIVARAGRS